MSGVRQRSKALKGRVLICRNTHCFSTKEDAKAYIAKQRNKGVRGSRTLEVFKCLIHSNRQGETYHVRQRRRDR